MKVPKKLTLIYNGGSELLGVFDYYAIRSPQTLLRYAEFYLGEFDVSFHVRRDVVR